jgi:carbon storage regulator CsrA
MLILSRRPGESVLIGPNVAVTLLSIRGYHARLGIDAPKQIPVQRPDAVVRLRSGVEPDPAVHALQQFSTDYFTALYLFHLADLGVADVLFSDPLNAMEIAEKVHADPQALKRALSFVASRGVFVEESDGRFRHNALSLLLRADHPRSQRALFRLGATHPAEATIGAIGQALRTGLVPAELMAPEGVLRPVPAIKRALPCRRFPQPGQRDPDRESNN